MKMKREIYEYRILKPRNEEINAEKNITVKDPTYVVAKKKAWKISACRVCNRVYYELVQWPASSLLP